MKVNTKKSTTSNKKLILLGAVSVFLALLIVLLCVFIDPTDNNYNIVPDQFGPFSDKVYPLEVEDSIEARIKFKLSDQFTISNPQNNLIDSNADYVYEVSYGSYPIITTELDATRLTTAYAMSILDMTYDEAISFTSQDKTVLPHLVKYTVERNKNLGIDVDSDGKVTQTILNTKTEYADISIVSSDGLISLMYYAGECATDIVCKNFVNDAVVIFTSIDNPVDSISKKELKAIYNGEIEDWSELGGEDEEICKYERCKYSSAQKAFDIYVFDKYQEEKKWSEILDVPSHADDRQEYENTPFSIGYCLKSQFDVSYAKDKSIKILEIDDIYPDDENISTRTYPLTVPYYYAYKLNDEDDTAEQFVEWMQTDEGLKCIYSAGLIPTKNEEEYCFVEGELEVY